MPGRVKKMRTKETSCNPWCGWAGASTTRVSLDKSLSVPLSLLYPPSVLPRPPAIVALTGVGGRVERADCMRHSRRQRQWEPVPLHTHIPHPPTVMHTSFVSPYRQGTRGRYGAHLKGPAEPTHARAAAVSVAGVVVVSCMLGM